ncbi:MAG: hypothetical protein GXO92_00225 [FCB group bacterium]|nr:hypothetical protein [FCB group bacterium]
MATLKPLLFNIGKTVKILVLSLWLLSGLYAQSIQIFSPEPGSTVLKTEVLIAASFFELGEVNPANVRLYVDGQDLTNRAMIDADMVSYTPAVMTPGKHEVRIFVKGEEGRSPVTKTWTFQVAGKRRAADLLELSGRVTTGYRYDKYEVEELAVGQFGINLRGSYQDWLRFKTNIKITTEEDPLIQPRNRFGFGVSLGRYLDLNIGDTNPKLSRFMVDGKRVRGVDANFKLGVINFHYVQGDINRAVQGGLDTDESYTLEKFVQEEDQLVMELNRKGYTFRQELKGGRLSFGRGENFQLGLSLVKVRDDISSVKKDLKNAKIELTSDTLGITAGIYTYSELIAMGARPDISVQLAQQSDWAGPAPQDNIVLGTDLGFYLDHKRILLEGELAFSMLNRDIWDGAVSKAQLDTLLDDSTDNKLAGSIDLDVIPFDPKDIESFFIINQNMSPLAPIDISIFGDSSNVSYGEAILSMPSIAMRTRAKLNYFGHYIVAEYSQVGPEFMSLANPYLLSNNRVFSVSDKIQLFKNRLLLTLLYKYQDDDISTTVTNVTSQNTIMTNLTFLPGPNLPTINLSFRLFGRNNGITHLDTLVNQSTGEINYSDNRENTQTANVTATLNYRFDAFDVRNDISGTIVNLEKNDLYDNRDLDTNFVDPGLTSSVYNLVINSRFAFPLKTSVSITSNASEFSIGPGMIAEQTFTSLKFDAEYGLFNRKLNLLGGVNYTSGAGQTDLKRFGIRGGFRFSLIENLTANMITEYRRSSTAQGENNNIIATANLSYTF